MNDSWYGSAVGMVTFFFLRNNGLTLFFRFWKGYGDGGVHDFGFELLLMMKEGVDDDG